MFKYRGLLNAQKWCDKFANDHELRTDWLLRENTAPSPASKPRYTAQERATYNKARKENARTTKLTAKHSTPYTSQQGRRDRGDTQYGDRGANQRGDRDENQSDRRRSDYQRDQRNRDQPGERNRDQPGERPPAPCRSRVGKQEPCVYGDKCRFSHKCLWCDGKDHPAKECPNWTQAKADAANAKFNMRLTL
jgi:hypothetical protein